MMNPSGNDKRPRPIYFLAAMLLCLSAPIGAADSDRAVARLAEPFEINGQVYEAGVIAVRTLGNYNPASTLVEVSVDNVRVGVLLARVARGDATKDPTLLFARDARGHLTLVGYTDRAGSKNAFYTFRVDADGGRWLPPARRDADGLWLASR